MLYPLSHGRVAETTGFEPAALRKEGNSLAGSPIRPLWHASKTTGIDPASAKLFAIAWTRPNNRSQSYRTQELKSKTPAKPPNTAPQIATTPWDFAGILYCPIRAMFYS